MVQDIYFRATARFILSPMLKNKFNSHDWLKILEPGKVTAKAFNEIPEFCLVVVGYDFCEDLLPILIYTVDFTSKYFLYLTQ